MAHKILAATGYNYCYMYIYENLDWLGYDVNHLELSRSANLIVMPYCFREATNSFTTHRFPLPTNTITHYNANSQYIGPKHCVITRADCIYSMSCSLCYVFTCAAICTLQRHRSPGTCSLCLSRTKTLPIIHCHLLTVSA